MKKMKMKKSNKKAIIILTMCALALAAGLHAAGTQSKPNVTVTPIHNEQTEESGTGILGHGKQTEESGIGILGHDKQTETADAFIADYGEWNLVLVNDTHPIPDNYTLEFTELRNGKKVDSRIYPDLQEMFDDMRCEGIYPIVSEGYRTAEEQEQIMTDKINAYISEGYSRKDAEKLAARLVAKVGYSEHQLGLALDINAEEAYSTCEDVYNWLAENAYKYGFILRYPADKTDITKIDYEPWHYRYVGKTAAQEIHSQGICLEEYLEERR